ncbi:MAG: DUF1440 domain-containing protein [Actinobacteria bacterium]|nr:DUF1440 domain-containing protein [Actinomycetota bacterium]
MRGQLVKGAVAGVVGTWLMDVAAWTLYRQASAETLREEDRTRIDGKDTAHAAARHLARAVGSDAAQEEPNAGGIFIHYQLGIAPGVAYATLRERFPWITAGKGALWGATLYVTNDLVAARLLRLTGPQRDYPWQTHVRGLIGHVVLGVGTHLTLEALDDAT